MMTELRIKPGAFISATEICDMWLVPEGHSLQNLDTFWATRADRRQREGAAVCAAICKADDALEQLPGARDCAGAAKGKGDRRDEV